MNDVVRLKNVLIWTAMLSSAVGGQALAQRGATASSLTRARATYDATDVDKNGKVSLEELRKNALPIQKPDFDAQDVDKDGAWSRDEFYVYYRQILVNGGQKAGDDLEGEVARIQALRKAKAAEISKREAAAKAAKDAANPPLPVPVTPEARMDRAIDDLEKKAATRTATPEDFKRVRDAMIDYDKVATAADPQGAPDLAKRFEDALRALETRAKDGAYTREEFGALRGLLAKRGREAAKSEAQGTSANAATPLESKPTETAVDVEARLQRAVDDLEKKALARGATREDFQRVRDSYAARAKVALQGADPTMTAEQNALVEKTYKALDALEANARAGNWSREEFEAARKTIMTRARAVASEGQGAVDGSPEAKVDGAVPASIEGRFEFALRNLEQKALARGATREDFQRVRDLLILRARAAVKGADGAPTVDPNDPAIAELAAKLQTALEKLEKDAAAGLVKPEDFAALRQMMIHRARAAANKDATGPAEARRRAAEAQTGESKTAETSGTTKDAKDAKDAGATPPANGAGPGSRVKPPDPKPGDPKPEPKPVDPKPADAGPGRGSTPPPAPPPEPPKEEKPARPPH